MGMALIEHFEGFRLLMNMIRIAVNFRRLIIVLQYILVFENGLYHTSEAKFLPASFISEIKYE